MVAVTWQFFDTSGNDLAALQRLARSRDDERQRNARALVCIRCRYLISSDAQRIDVAGAHTHTCTNPHGIVYHIGCFGAAPGCVSVGPRLTEYSWFQGYRWQVALCSNCQTHLGWLFHGEQCFYGLIHDRLGRGPL